MRTRTITAAAATAVIGAFALTGCGSTPAKAPATTATPVATATIPVADLTGQGLGIQGPPPGVAAPGR